MQDKNEKKKEEMVIDPTGNVFDEEKPSKGSNERKPKGNII